MRLTVNEYRLLDAIIHCEFHDGRDPVDHAVWTSVVTETFGRSAQGIIASTNKKGWTKSQGDGAIWTTQKGAIWITQEGHEVWKNAVVGEVLPPWSYNVEATDDGKTWAPNGLFFATREEAEGYARDLRSRWTGCRDTRVVRRLQDVNYKFEAGVLYGIDGKAI